MVVKGDKSWQKLRQVIEGRRPDDRERPEVVFVLGAGVSVGNHADGPLVPSWRALVRRLARRTKLQEAVESAIDDQWAEPRIIEAVRAQYSGSWPEHLRSCLYEDLRSLLAKHDVGAESFLHTSGGGMSDPSAFARFINDYNPVLARLMELWALGEPGQFRPNPRVAAVLTYNIDELVQKYDRARHGGRVLRTIERASTPRHFGKLPLYHLHGFVKASYHKRQEAADSLVLSESEYHRRTDHTYAFATTTMLWALREHVCVFVGCSMRDELMRRALYRSNDERIRALQSKYETQNEKIATKRLRHFAVMKQDALSDLVRDDLERLGVSPLWVTDFGALPNQLDALKGTIARAHEEDRTY